MLTAESYMTAWLVYAVAAAGVLLCLHLSWLGRLPGPARLSVLLVFAVLMLTPAHPADDVDTWAPAIVVAGFDLLTDGVDAALARGRLLGALCLLALLPGLAWALFGRGRGSRETAEGA